MDILSCYYYDCSFGGEITAGQSRITDWYYNVYHLQCYCKMVDERVKDRIEREEREERKCKR